MIDTAPGSTPVKTEHRFSGMWWLKSVVGPLLAGLVGMLGRSYLIATHRAEAFAAHLWTGSILLGVLVLAALVYGIFLNQSTRTDRNETRRVAAKLREGMCYRLALRLGTLAILACIYRACLLR